MMQQIESEYRARGRSWSLESTHAEQVDRGGSPSRPRRHCAGSDPKRRDEADVVHERVDVQVLVRLRDLDEDGVLGNAVDQTAQGAALPRPHPVQQNHRVQ